jgi:hypothetical protein
VTLAHMARIVGLAPDRLVEAGRGTAAEILREIQRQEAEQMQPEPAPYADMSDRLERAVWEMNLDEEDRRELVDMLREHKARQQRRDSA